MNDNSDDDIFTGAVIKPDGNTGAWDDSYRGVTRIEIPNHVYWFTPDERFDKNGNDFWIVIHYFGFTIKGAAGTKFGEGRAIFTAKQAESAKKRITEYYWGSEDKIVFPFNRARSRFLGVIFGEGWIRVKD